MSRPPEAPCRWPLWLLGATLLGLLGLAYLYWLDPTRLDLLGSASGPTG